MPGIRNTIHEYGSIAVLLHWIMAALIMIGLASGWYMITLPPSLRQTRFYDAHISIGMLILMLALVRIVWRFSHIVPNLVNHLPLWEVIIARSVHWMFYFLMVWLPLTGWFMMSARGWVGSFFGWFKLPCVISVNQQIAEHFSQAHAEFSYILLGFILLHLFAALKHHFINHNDVMRRMYP